MRIKALTLRQLWRLWRLARKKVFISWLLVDSVKHGTAVATDGTHLHFCDPPPRFSNADTGSIAVVPRVEQSIHPM